MIRLGIRVRAEDAEIAFARLEPVLAAGAEEIDLFEDDAVEFAVYGDSLPSDEALKALAGDTIVSLVRSPVDAGWARAWQDHLAPVTVGAFTIRPPWLEGDAVGSRHRSRARPSAPRRTRRPASAWSCCRSLDGGGALVDWGTGSGVLAIAAARLGFAPVVAVELDMAAAHVAKRNAGRNGAVVEVVVGDVTSGRAVGADDRREPHAPAARGGRRGRVAPAASPLAAAATPCPGRGSSPPASSLRSADEAVAAWAPLGFVERERRELDGWAALVLERAA